ncbi:MAG: hypothetical protein R3B45_16065 [Bdellovibrionota bacterium]
MYNMDIEARPKIPVIASQLSAHNITQQWLKENDYSVLLDGDGSSWDVEVHAKEVPSPLNPHGLLWELSLILKMDLTVDEMLRIGVFNQENDSRLLAMLEEEKIPLLIRPKTFQGDTDEDARRKLTNALPKVRADLVRSNLLKIKRNLACRWIDESRCFAFERV